MFCISLLISILRRISQKSICDHDRLFVDISNGSVLLSSLGYIVDLYFKSDCP